MDNNWKKEIQPDGLSSGRHTSLVHNDGVKDNSDICRHVYVYDIWSVLEYRQTDGYLEQILRTIRRGILPLCLTSRIKWMLLFKEVNDERSSVRSESHSAK